MARKFKNNILEMNMDERLVYLGDNNIKNCGFNEAIEITKNIIKKTKEEMNADDMYFNIDVLNLYNVNTLGYCRKKNSEDVTFTAGLEDSVRYLIRWAENFYTPNKSLAVIISEIIQFIDKGVVHTKFIFTTYTIDKEKTK